MTDDVRDAIERIRSWADKASKDARFTVRFEEFPAPSRDEIDGYEEVIAQELGLAAYAIPSALLEVYSHTGGIDLQWTSEDRGTTIAGTCRIAGLFELYQRDEEGDVPLRNCVKIARPFDVISDDEVAAIGFSEEARDIRQMLLIDQESQTAKVLSYTPASYLAAAAEHLGIYGWQRGEQNAGGEKLTRSLLGDSA